MSKRQKVQYSGMGGEPAFLAAFKKKVGYQEPEEDVDMEAKKAKLMKDFDERELDDELPQVELGKGVSANEAETFLQRDLDSQKAEKAITDGEAKDESLSTAKSTDDSQTALNSQDDIPPTRSDIKKPIVAQVGLKAEKAEKKKKKKSKMKAVKNSKLLSFGDE
ncbi:unnamed protein product [Oikopleura dioica]|uniref:DUF4604 domain-containing protein n=1 Tax=Oikopleura dioica TaxID=34765 RepID=E4YFJ7_OIKDI|nr:unnamed protein product [Oikopleura dioica]